MAESSPHPHQRHQSQSHHYATDNDPASLHHSDTSKNEIGSVRMIDSTCRSNCMELVVSESEYGDSEEEENENGNVNAVAVASSHSHIQTHSSHIHAHTSAHAMRVDLISDEEENDSPDESKQKAAPQSTPIQSASDIIGGGSDIFDSDSDSLFHTGSILRRAGTELICAARRGGARRGGNGTGTDENSNGHDSDDPLPFPKHRSRTHTAAMKTETAASQDTQPAMIDCEGKGEDTDEGKSNSTPTRRTALSPRKTSPRFAPRAGSALVTTAAAAPHFASVDQYEFAQLDSPSQRFAALMHGLAGRTVLVTLVQLVARAVGEEGQLERDPVIKAKLFLPSSTTGGANKNLRCTTEFVKHFSRQPAALVFTERLTAAKLRSYESSMPAYLKCTGGIPPIDFSSILNKLSASHPDGSGIEVDAEGMASAYPNSVGAVITDVVTVIINAAKFNPPNHFVHLLALELAEKLPRALFALRRQIKIDDDEIVCYICGDASSDVDSVLGVLMQCDSCSLWYHTLCADVPSVPKESWHCDDCVRANPKLQNKRIRPVTQQTIQPHQSTPLPGMRTHTDCETKEQYSGSTKRKDSSTENATASKKQRSEHAAIARESHQRVRPSPSPRPPSPGLNAAVAALSTMVPPIQLVKGRPVSPDGEWFRVQKLDVRHNDPIHRNSSRQEDLFQSSTADPYSLTNVCVNNADREVENELRSVRQQLDTAMRCMAASSQRITHIQSKQRNRTRKQLIDKVEYQRHAQSLQKVMDVLTAPIEQLSDSAESSQLPHVTATDAEAAPIDIAELPASMSVKQLKHQLQQYRHRFLAQTALLRHQSSELEHAKSVASTVSQQYEDIRQEAQCIQEHQHRQIIELESSLSNSKLRLASERRIRNDCQLQFHASQLLVIRMVDRLNRTVVGSKMCAAFGTKLLDEVQKNIAREQETQKEQQPTQHPSVRSNTTIRVHTQSSSIPETPSLPLHQIYAQQIQVPAVDQLQHKQGQQPQQLQQQLQSTPKSNGASGVTVSSSSTSASTLSAPSNNLSLSAPPLTSTLSVPPPIHTHPNASILPPPSISRHQSDPIIPKSIMPTPSQNDVERLLQRMISPKTQPIPAAFTTSSITHPFQFASNPLTTTIPSAGRNISPFLHSATSGTFPFNAHVPVPASTSAHPINPFVHAAPLSIHPIHYSSVTPIPMPPAHQTVPLALKPMLPPPPITSNSVPIPAKPTASVPHAHGSQHYSNHSISLHTSTPTLHCSESVPPTHQSTSDISP
jgi:hypothetical protein